MRTREKQKTYENKEHCTPYFYLACVVVLCHFNQLCVDDGCCRVDSAILSALFIKKSHADKFALDGTVRMQYY